MPSLFARRYARPLSAVSGTEKLIGLLCLVLVVAIIAAFVAQLTNDRSRLFDVAPQLYESPAARPEAGPAEAYARGAAQASSSLPDFGEPDWQAPERVEQFDSKQLYIKIDGRAEVYQRFGVVGLTFGRYQNAADAGRTLDVYWYTMGTPSDALAAYEFEAPRDASRVPVGQGGYQAGGAVFFHQGAHYVQVLPSGLDEADATAALRLAKCLAAHIAHLDDLQ